MITVSNQLVSAQNFVEDLAKAYKAYENASRLDFKMAVKIYEGTSTKPMVREINIHRQDDAFVYQDQQMTTVMGEQGLVMLDGEEKEIVFQKLTKNERATLSKKMHEQQFDFDLSGFEKVTFVGESNGVKHYQLMLSDHVIRQVDVYLNSKTLMFQKLVYDYFPDEDDISHKVITEFSNTQRLAANMYDVASYVDLVNKEPKPSQAYPDYELLLVQ